MAVVVLNFGRRLREAKLHLPHALLLVSEFEVSYLSVLKVKVNGPLFGLDIEGGLLQPEVHPRDGLAVLRPDGDFRRFEGKDVLPGTLGGVEDGQELAQLVRERSPASDLQEGRLQRPVTTKQLEYLVLKHLPGAEQELNNLLLQIVVPTGPQHCHEGTQRHVPLLEQQLIFGASLQHSVDTAHVGTPYAEWHGRGVVHMGAEIRKEQLPSPLLRCGHLAK
mmetsp:Transcript_105627/g.182154  ORF Transcript_105627/g.182154 Transcript_105627/m.182154 type:complete len:221 (-) Transcript_105627:414-1076(-)